MKTAGDWLKVKRLEKNLTPGRVAAKMGIAASLVCSWESSTRQPDNQHLEVLASVLDFDTKDFEYVIAGLGFNQTAAGQLLGIAQRSTNTAAMHDLRVLDE